MTSQTELVCSPAPEDVLHEMMSLVGVFFCFVLKKSVPDSSPVNAHQPSIEVEQLNTAFFFPPLFFFCLSGHRDFHGRVSHAFLSDVAEPAPVSGPHEEGAGVDRIWWVSAKSQNLCCANSSPNLPMILRNKILAA